MSTSIGRFWTADQFEGLPIEPISLHKYLYANTDPTNRVDPSGEVTVIDTVVAGATRNTIQSMQIPIWKKVVATVLIGLLVAGVVSGPGTAFEEHANRLNSMRVQLQEGLHTHIHSKKKHNTEPPGVTVQQMELALTQLFFESKSLIPGHLESDFLGAIARTGIYIRRRHASGGVPAFETGHLNSEHFQDRSKQYRVDIENSFGHNLRQLHGVGQYD